MATLAELEGRALVSIADLLSAADLPDGIIEPLSSFDELLSKISIAEAAFDTSRGGVQFDATVVIDGELVLAIPGLDAVKLVIGGFAGLTVFDLHAAFHGEDIASARFRLALDNVPLTLRVDGKILRPLRGTSDEPDPNATALDIVCGMISFAITEAGVELGFDADLQIPRCMIGSTGIILTVGSARWITPSSDPSPSGTPDQFTGLYLDGAKIEFVKLGIGDVTLNDVFIGNTGFSGNVAWRDDDLTWNPQGGANNDGGFEGVLTVELSGFDGAVQKLELEFRQSALVACEIAGCIYAPYIKRVIGLDIGLDGDGGFTAIAQAPTCKFTNNDPTAAAGPAKPGYILSADIENVFKFDVSRIEFHAGGGKPASLSLSGRVKLVIDSFDLPAVEFKGLSIDTAGHVAIEGGWLDVDQAKSGPLSGFPLQITRIGFGVEKDGRAWVGLNGSVKLHESLPAGVSVEGLKVSWKKGAPVNFSLEGIGVELAVKGVFSFAGKAAFFQTDEASGFRGSLKLSLESVGLTIDVGIMVGRMNDGTFFFYLYIDVELPVGIPLFSTGAALYGFAGLLAVNLQPARIDAEHWYYGYYKRQPVGLTAPEKWAVKKDAFAVGVGTTIGSMPDTGYAISAKVLLILSLPGPRIFLQGKGSFIEKKPENKNEAQEGTFEALLVLDTPAQLFQANLAITFKMGALLEVGGGVDAAFSWAKDPPADVWHVYVGEKQPVERRVHAKVLEFLKGDTWLMINRPHFFESDIARQSERLGDFEIGGSLMLGADFDFAVVKVWLHASIFAQAAVTWEPQQIVANASLNGSAGIMALGMELSAELNADALAKASKPFYFGASVEVEVRVNLIFFKWSFHEKISIEYTRPALPDYVHSFVALKSDHLKVSEARDLEAARVPPDVRPVVIFSKPVRDLAWFGTPGNPDLPVEDLILLPVGDPHARQVSYQLRHVVLLAVDGTPAAPYRLVAAAGRVRVSDTNVEFIGVRGDRGPLPDLAGSELRLFNVGDITGQTFTLTAGIGNSATLTGSAPQGELCYRLSAPRATASVTIASVADAGFSQVEATLTGALANPQRFRGGTLASGSATWTIANATASAVRVQTLSGTAPTAGAAALAGPDPAQLEGEWQAAGDPVEGSGSTMRLQVWGRTPYSMFRYNELETIAELDAFDPDYACGPDAVELPVCTRFEDVPTGALSSSFSTAGIQGTHGGAVSAVGVADGPKLLVFAANSLTKMALTFDPPVDAVWISATRQEFGVIRAYSGGVKVGENPIKPGGGRYRFDGGIDRIEIDGQDASVDEICFTPGWKCVAFESSFPSNTTGVVRYAGVQFGSAATLRVADGVLHAVPRRRPLSGATIARTKLLSALGEGAGAGIPVIEVPGLEASFITVTPLLGDVRFEPGPLAPAARGLSGGWRTARSTALIETLPRRIAIQQGSIWNLDAFVPLVALTIEFERPVTRARILLGQQPASAVALAGTLSAAAASGAPGTAIALYADPHVIGWFNRVVLTAPGELEIAEICTDRGDFGWQRYQQWTWRQGVQRSIESLYSKDPVLPPGQYELRVHTAAVVTGEQPETDDLEVVAATFQVGAPPGFAPIPPHPLPAGADPRAWNYPEGGPLTQLTTYVDRTMPANGARLWYRSLDTAVSFNENYVTRMYLEADEELRVFVLNSSDVALRDGTRHVWGGGSAALDATTSLYVRTLSGDGTDTCADVDVSRIALPEAVTAGSGELLDASALHRSQLRTRRSGVVVHEVEFTTSLFASFRHLAATYDGLCPRLAPRAQGVAWEPRDVAQARIDSLAQLDTERGQAVATLAAGRADGATRDQIEAAAKEPAALAVKRASRTATAAAAFADSWAKTFETLARPARAGLRLSVVSAGNPTATDLLLLESPEPIAWERVQASICAATAVPLSRRTITLASDFGRPDLGFQVAYGGLLWRAGVELWFNDGALRARAGVPLDVTLVLPRSSSADLVVRAADAQSVLAECDPPATQVSRIALADPGTFRLLARAPAQTTLKTLRVRGAGVGIVSCTVDTPFRPRQPAGPLRIVAVKLPNSASDLTHELTLMATAPVSLQGWSVRWVDPVTGGASELYAECTANLPLTEARRVRFMPSLASAAATEDALVVPGGAGTAPPTTGAVFQLLDPAGTCVHEYAAMAPGGAARTLAIIPDADGSRAWLIPPRNEAALTAGFWQLTLTLVGDANAPDLDRWTVGGRAVVETAQLPLLIEAEPAFE
jgi:hypothetical protein